MTTMEQAASGGLFSFLDRCRTVAKPGFSRWMVPPAALCVHLCIGQAYAFSVFNLPMTKLVGISQSAPNDWNIPELGWIFSIAIFVLGFSAAIFGRWVQEGGPRRAMFTAALCWAGGFIISAIGVYIHNLWVVYFGYGLVGGCGLGIGYISPVSTLIKWFPDRPGMWMSQRNGAWQHIRFTAAFAVLMLLLPHAALATGPRVILLRGWFGVFSTGLDSIADQLKASLGIEAKVAGHLNWSNEVAGRLNRFFGNIKRLPRLFVPVHTFDRP